ncbi:mechanosensitive ion channel family protein [Neisseriaceae bacterium CLB008]|nr:mechanosensitive ion channel [Neisseriaceae bacterium]
MLADQRKMFASNLLEQSFNSTAGWIEFFLAIAIGLVVRHFVLNWLSKRETPNARLNLGRHIMHRIVWPLSVCVVSSIVAYLWHLAGLQPLWLLLAAVISPWLAGVRTIMAVISHVLPNKFLERSLEYFLAGLLWGGYVVWLIGLDSVVIDWLNRTSLTIGSSSLSLMMLATGLLWVCVAIIAALSLGRTIDKRVMGMRNVDLNSKFVISKLVRSILIILAVIITLPMVGIDLTIISVFGGALGVGLAFGLQKIASNYVSGFIILLDRSIRVGDRLLIDNRVGYVSRINSRYVVLKGTDGAEILVPNERFIADTVINQSFTDTAILDSVHVAVAYGTDIPQALTLLNEAATKHQRIQKDPAPFAYIKNFGDSGIDLGLNYWVENPSLGMLGIKSAIMLDIWHQFKEHGIEMPFPQQEVRILNEPSHPQPSRSAQEHRESEAKVEKVKQDMDTHNEFSEVKKTIPEVSEIQTPR